MTVSSLITRIHKGMQVQTIDGQTLGTVTSVWLGIDPTLTNPTCYEDLCSRVEVHHGFLGLSVLYVPSNAIAEVTADEVTLSVDAATVTEHNWSRKPAWVGD